jgi:ribosome-binding factor A
VNRRRQTPREGQGRPVRPLKVGEAMRHVLAELLARGEIHDEALDGRIISVSEVRVSPDLRQATAYIRAVGVDAVTQQSVCQALNRHSRAIKSRLAQAVNTKYAADLAFAVDESFTEAERIDALLRSPQVARDLTADTGTVEPE